METLSVVPKIECGTETEKNSPAKHLRPYTHSKERYNNLKSLRKIISTVKPKVNITPD